MTKLTGRVEPGLAATALRSVGQSYLVSLDDWFKLICNLLVKHFLPTVAVKVRERNATPRTMPYASAATQ